MKRNAQSAKLRKHYQNLRSAEPEKMAMIHGAKIAVTKPRELETLLIQQGQAGSQKPRIRGVS